MHLLASLLLVVLAVDEDLETLIPFGEITIASRDHTMASKVAKTAFGVTPIASEATETESKEIKTQSGEAEIACVETEMELKEMETE